MKKVAFEVIKGRNIFYSLSIPSSKSKKIVIMSHGFRGSSIGPARSFVEFEKVLNRQGISTLRFDQPCSANSDGDYLDSSFDDWMATTEYFAEKYLGLGYQVILFGQSMGATNTMIVAAKKSLRNRIPAVILWVPDPKTTVVVQGSKVYEEAGQQYLGEFWLQAKEADFFSALSSYQGGIHLVYGDQDRYISQDLREQVITKVKSKNQEVMILKGQDHSPWSFKVAQEVYQQELDFVLNYFK